MTAWEYPKLEKEAKLLFTDDLAGLYLAFGYETVERAIEWHRQHAERSRPAIGKIREQCEAHRPARTAPQAEIEHMAYLRDVKLHPELYVPVDECVAVGQKVAIESARRKAEGKPMSEGERQALIRRLSDEMNTAWLEKVAKERTDRKTVAAGA